MTGKQREFRLSKSKIAMFEQCPKRLWLHVHHPELGQPDMDTEARFAVGHEVGAVACRLIPTGVMVYAEPDLDTALAETRKLLDADEAQPIFEATLEHDGVLVRIDILEPDEANSWRLAEVKSSTGVKDYHMSELATQLWVAQRAGLAISGAAIRHIDNRFVLEREGDYHGLFIDSDQLADLAQAIEDRPRVVQEAHSILDGKEPAITPGDQCKKPFDCEFSAYCNSSVPAGPQWPVTLLPNGGGKKFLAQGIADLLALDPAMLTNGVQKRVYQATMTGAPYHDADNARQEMAKWPYPRTWLDFETIAFAVPRWMGTRPYQQVPFQFSAHVEDADGKITHHDFLSLDGTDPRRACAEALVASVPSSGAVIGYNASFERSRILELAAAFPDLADSLQDIAERVVDLLPITRANWYHRDQRGSWSIKAVLPTITDQLNYTNLAVKDGEQAQVAYIQAISPSTTEVRRAEIAVALRTYCRLDTEAMILIAKRLESVAG